MKPVELNVGGKIGYLPAILISWEQSHVDAFTNTFTQKGIYYCQNRLAEQVHTYNINPENGEEKLVSSKLNILVEYCVIPEADSILNDI